MAFFAGVLFRGAVVKPLIVAVLLCTPLPSRAQTVIDTTYRLEVTATASPMINFFRLPRVPGTASKTSVGYGTSVRILWHPGRLLSVGLSTGYLVIAQDEIDVPNTDLRYHARLTAVPLQIALSMQRHGLEIGVEIGPYLMMSLISGGTSPEARGSRLELATTVFASYLFTLQDVIQFGPEVRIVDLRYRGIVCVMPSLSFRIIPLRY